MASKQTQEVDFVEKLSKIKEIREKTRRLEKVKVKLLQRILLLEEENKNLVKFKEEEQNLEFERHFHLDALQNVEDDLLSVRNIISEAEKDRQLLCEDLQQLSDDYTPLKVEVETLRGTAGLSTLVDDFPELDTVAKLGDGENQKSGSCFSSNESVETYNHQLSLPSTSRPTELSCLLTKVGMDSCDPCDSSDKVSFANSNKGKAKAPKRACSHCGKFIPRTAPSCTACKHKTLSQKRLKRSGKLYGD